MNVRESPPRKPMLPTDTRKRAGIVALIVGVLAVGLYLWLGSGPAPTDQQQIQALLTEGEKAVEEKNLSALMGLVSKDFKMEPLNRDRLRLAIGQGFRNYSTVYVNLNDVAIRTQGDTASVSATVSIDAQGKDPADRASNTMPMTFRLKKEPGHRFLVFPDETWRVVGASGFNIDSGMFEF